MIPVNEPSLVSLLLTQLNADYETPVPGFDRSLGDLLTYQFEIRSSWLVVFCPTHSINLRDGSEISN